MPLDAKGNEIPTVVLGLGGSVIGGSQASQPDYPPGYNFENPQATAIKRTRNPQFREDALRGRTLVRGDVLFYSSPQAGPQLVCDLTHDFVTLKDEEPASRSLKIGTSWEPLLKQILPMIEDWEGPPSLVYLENLHGLDRQQRPFPEEEKDDAAHVIEIGPLTGAYGADKATPTIRVRPGRGVAFEPVGALYARCPAGPCKARLVVLPPNFLPHGDGVPPAPEGK